MALHQKTAELWLAIAVETKQMEEAIDHLIPMINVAKGNCQPAKGIVLKLL